MNCVLIKNTNNTYEINVNDTFIALTSCLPQEKAIRQLAIFDNDLRQAFGSRYISIHEKENSDTANDNSETDFVTSSNEVEKQSALSSRQEKILNVLKQKQTHKPQAGKWYPKDYMSQGELACFIWDKFRNSPNTSFDKKTFCSSLFQELKLDESYLEPMGTRPGNHITHTNNDPFFYNEVAWIVASLKDAGLVKSGKRNVWKISNTGVMLKHLCFSDL